MKYELDRSTFVELFDKYNRSENFSIRARDELFDYYESLEDGSGSDFVVDIIAICCDWSEYTADEILSEYSHLFDSFDDDEIEGAKESGEEAEYIKSVLDDNTTVIEVEHYDSESTYLVLAF